MFIVPPLSSYGLSIAAQDALQGCARPQKQPHALFLNLVHLLPLPTFRRPIETHQTPTAPSAHGISVFQPKGEFVFIGIEFQVHAGFVIGAQKLLIFQVFHPHDALPPPIETRRQNRAPIAAPPRRAQAEIGQNARRNKPNPAARGC